jgi:hypothetical protein
MSATPAAGAQAAPGAPASTAKDAKSAPAVGGGAQVDHPEPGVAGGTQPGANGEGKGAVPSVDASHEEDAFLSELRKAMSDDEPRSQGAGPIAGQGSESPTLQSSGQAASADQDKPRFGRRR